MDPHNRKEALRECALDAAEGTDILMVKPALSYLDVIRECADSFDLPLCAYSVYGEHAMIKADTYMFCYIKVLLVVSLKVYQQNNNVQLQ